MDVQLFERSEVEHCISMPRAIELMRAAFTALFEGTVRSPVRTILTNEGGTVLYKPAYSNSSGLFCVKVVSVFPDNVNRSLPVTPGVIVVNDGATGMPVAIMDAGFITSLRTGAATGLATDLLAVPDARVAALFGTGGQAWHQLEAMLAVRSLKKIYVFSRKPKNAKRFCEQHQAKCADCELVAQPSVAALAEADIVTTATTSPTPVFADQHLKRTVHINAIGSLGPKRSEIPPETILRSDVILDQRDAGLREAGELMPLIEDGRLPFDFCPLELGELIAGVAPVPSANCTVFKSAGNAAQDIVCAAEVLQVAAQHKVGRTVQL